MHLPSVSGIVVFCLTLYSNSGGILITTVVNFSKFIFQTLVSYLMYGPFGSFAPTYDTSFANLTKHDSSLLLSTYGNEVGVNYANRYN